MFLRISISIASAALLLACTVNPRDHFDHIQSTILSRTGQHIQWTLGTEDQPSKALIQNLLQNELSLDQLLQIALLNNPDLQATYEDAGIAQADLAQAGLLKNPVISAEVRFPGRPNNPVEVNLEDQFLDALFLPLRKKIAEASFSQAQATVIDAVLRRAAEVHTAYYKHQADLQLLALRKTALAATQTALEASQRLRDAGNIRDLEVANDQAAVAQATLDLSAAQLQSAESREALTLLMGLSGPEADTWKIAPQLSGQLGPDLPADNLENLALAQRQDLLAASSAVDVATQTAAMATSAALLSGATFGAHDQRDADVHNTLGPSISAPIPIFDQGQAASARAQSQLRQSQDRYQSLALQIRAQVREAYTRMLTARQTAAYFHDIILPLRQRIVDETLLQYNGMFVGLTVLIEARQQQLNASEKYIEALRDYWIARAQLEAAIGSQLPVPAQPAPTTTPTTQPK